MAEIYLSDLKSEVAARIDMGKGDVEKVLRTFFDVAGDHLAIGDDLYLLNFVNIKTKDVAEKHVKHPQNGTPMTIDSYRSLSIKPTDSQKEKLRLGIKTHPKN